MASAFAWLYSLVVSVILYKKFKGSEELVEYMKKMSEGTDAFIRNILRFMTPLFIMIGKF